MNKKLLKKTAYVLAFTMLVETAIINLDTKAFSKEKISLEEMNENKAKALLWIKGQQNEDGSFGDTLKTYYTTQFLENTEYENDANDEKTAALQYLENIETNSNDDLFRKYNAVVKNNEYYSIKMDKPKWNELQNADGGFSLADGYKSDILDTVLAVGGMLEGDGSYSTNISKAIDYIKCLQNDDGSFSYVDEIPNIYLTAYTFKTIGRFLNENANSSAKNTAQKAELHLLNNEEENSLWGMDEDTIRNSLMASIALAKDDDITLKRISILSDKLGEDGSIYSDVDLTSLYVSLINEYEIACGKIDLNYVKIKDVKICADKERIGAYTEVKFIPNVLGMKDNNKIIAVVSGKDGYTKKLELSVDDSFIWNTELNIGQYEVVIAVIDSNDGSIVASKSKTIEVYETFDVKAVAQDISPKAYKIDSGKSIKIDIAALALSNISKEVTAKINVQGEDGRVWYEETVKASGGKDKKEIRFDTLNYQPILTETEILTVTTNIIVDGKLAATKTNYVKAYTSEDENRIDIDYDTNTNFVYPETDELDVSFKLSGKGLSETVKRKPMDIVIILDNSGSMGRQDWLKAIEGAKIIIDYMQPQDRAEIRYINYNKVQVEFSSDKDYLKNELNKRSNQFLFSGTPVYKSLNLSVKDFKDDERDRAVYIFTDGVRDGDVSKLNEQELIDNNIKVYSVFMECNASKSAIEEATEIMNHIADFTGGMALNVPTNDQIASCVTDLLGDLFNMAGKDVKLTMTLDKDVPFENIEFDIQPEEKVNNEDGTTIISFNRDYLSVGEDLDLNVEFMLSNVIFNDKIKLIKDIKLTYTDENSQTVEIALDDIFLDIDNNKSDVVPALTTEEGENDNSDIDITEEDDTNMLSHNKPEISEEENKELISGNMELSDGELFVGDNLIADVKLTSLNLDKQDVVKTKIVLIDTENQSNAKEVQQNLNIDNDNGVETSIGLYTENLYEGQYIAILMAEINGQMEALDADGITLKEHRYALTVSVGNGGKVNEESNQYKAGQVVNLTATAENGYIFDRWVSDDIELLTSQVNSSDISITMPDKEASIKAIFATSKANNQSGDSDSQDSYNSNNTNENVNNGKTNNNQIDTSNDNNVVDKKDDNSHKVSNVPKKENGGRNNTETKDSISKNNDSNGSGSLFSPLTGDFEIKDTIRVLLLIQSIALIAICVSLKKREEIEQKEV